MEEARLRESEEIKHKYCSVCNEEDPEYFYYNTNAKECLGCSECMRRINWDEYNPD